VVAEVSRGAQCTFYNIESLEERGWAGFVANSPLPPRHTYDTRNYTMEGAAAAHFIVNMGAGNGIFIVGM
jgi:hypothetical protein